MKMIPPNRWLLYVLILVSGFLIAAGFMAFNTSYYYFFWPILIIFGIVFVVAITKLL